MSVMKLRKLGNTINLKGKRVLIRIDANVPVVGGRVQDGPHGRIARCAVDINWLAQRGAKVIIMAHLGRPKGRRVSAYSLKPVAKRLSGLLGSKIKLTRSVVGKDVEKSVAAMQEGDILLLENLRFDSREEENAPSFAEALAKFGDLYVNDAFSVSHRAHASIDAIASNLPSYAGPLLAQEISVLSRLEQKAKHPFVLVLGGLKMSTKLPIIKRFIDQLDTVLIGGALANIFLVAQGLSVGKSIFEEGVLEEAKLLLNTYGEKIILPVDVVCARSLRKDAKKTVCSINQINEKDRIVDIGPQTEHATTIVGGGDTLPVIESFHLADKFTLLSTGGAALLQFLSGEALPGIDALKIS